jgi:hypothetical protein
MDEVGWVGRLMGRVRSKSTDSKDVVGLECLLLSTAVPHHSQYLLRRNGIAIVRDP